MLQNVTWLAIVAVHTEENESLKIGLILNGFSIHSSLKRKGAPNRRVPIRVAAEVVVTQVSVREEVRYVHVLLRALLNPVLAEVSAVRLVLAADVILPVSAQRLTATQILADVRQENVHLLLEQLELVHFDQVFLKSSRSCPLQEKMDINWTRAHRTYVF